MPMKRTSEIEIDIQLIYIVDRGYQVLVVFT